MILLYYWSITIPDGVRSTCINSSMLCYVMFSELFTLSLDSERWGGGRFACCKQQEDRIEFVVRSSCRAFSAILPVFFQGKAGQHRRAPHPSLFPSHATHSLYLGQYRLVRKSLLCCRLSARWRGIIMRNLT